MSDEEANLDGDDIIQRGPALLKEMMAYHL